MERHKITPTLRARMIDWMIEVLTNFKCDDQTFFLAVSLQDRFAKGCDKILEVGDLHVLGVTSMFVASKFEDIYPLKMKTVHEKIAHKAISAKEILAKESEFLRLFNFQIDFVTHFDFHQTYTDKITKLITGNQTQQHLVKLIAEQALVLTKMSI